MKVGRPRIDCLSKNWLLPTRADFNHAGGGLRPGPSMCRNMRGESTPVRSARMLGSSAYRKCNPYRTATPRFSKT